MKSSGNFKSPGIDNIVYKTEVARLLIPIMTDVLLGKKKQPGEWLNTSIVPIPKKGDLTQPSNYRGISLMSTAAKIYNNNSSTYPANCGETPASYPKWFSIKSWDKY